MDMSKPLYYDRKDTPLPDRAYKDVLDTADKGLKQKEKGPWGQLSKEEKIACRLLLTHRLRQPTVQTKTHTSLEHIFNWYKFKTKTRGKSQGNQ